MVITYLDNSGFAVDMGELMLIFDYANDHGARGLAHGTVGPEDLARHRRVIALISHAHGDHFHRAIAAWPAERVLSYDIPRDIPGTFVSPGDRLDLEGVSVEVYDSTDIGVSFLVRAQGISVFHAGDLNCWHWQDESTPEESARARSAFDTALRPLARKRADVAFLPVDSRLGTSYDEGALAMAAVLAPGVILPMHAHGDRAAVEAYARRQGGDVRILLERGASTRV